MAVVLTVSNTPKIAQFTGIFAGACVAAFIVLETPLSGMSMNPARIRNRCVAGNLDGALGIFSRPTAGNADNGGGLQKFEPADRLRQVASSKWPALYFLRISEREISRAPSGHGRDGAVAFLTNQ
jgi:hypothetical protein